MAVRAGNYSSVIKKLSGQANNVYDPNDPTAVAPTKAPIGYGVFAQGLSGALAQGANDPFYGGADVAALQNYTDRERADVAHTSAAAQKAAYLQAVGLKMIDKMDTKGTLAEMDRANADPYGIFNGVTIDADAAIRRQADVAASHKTSAEAQGELYKAGVKLDSADVNNGQGNPITGQAASYGVIPGAASNADQAAMVTANANATKAEADMIDAKNPNKYAKGGGSGGGSTTSIVVPIPGVGMATVKGKDPTQLMAQAKGMQGPSPTAGGPVANLAAAAQRHGFTSSATADGGLVVSDGKGHHIVYNAQGMRQ